MAASSDDPAVLDRFSPPTRQWFRSSFAGPTAAQAQAWTAISAGHHTLVVAPTGSGKTLAAFLWAIDRLISAAVTPPTAACRVVYVSPLKALAADVERNLAVPLAGIQQTALGQGLATPRLRVATRTGDTPARARRAFATRPSDILITTPESLFLLLTSRAREALTQVETVIVDEVHAVAGSKRGAHLAFSLERLDALLPAPAQRIGLSATVRPVAEVGRFLAGGRPVQVVAPPVDKTWDLRVVAAVPDLSDIGQAPADRVTDRPADPTRAASIWPHIADRIVDLVAAQRATLVFANSRRVAERLTSSVNDEWARRHDPSTPAPVLARAHHGSVSREQRRLVEEDLKAGRLPAVVATSSLELGIDMGAVDLVIQAQCPPSVSSGLQRVGRAGHQVGATSRAVLFPTFRGDLLASAVLAERMRAGQIESLSVPVNPLDVLAQQVVAICAMDSWSVDEVLAVARRAAPFATLSRSLLEDVLDMLCGRYPSEEFAELRPRLVWDRRTGTLTPRPHAQRLAVISGGTIPDRGLFGVFLSGAAGADATAQGGGLRVGELDEEMVYESRVGDVFTLGTSSWRIEKITHDRVLVTPAPGVAGGIPFWRAEAPGRPAELGTAIGAFIREVANAPADVARERAAATGLDGWGVDNLLSYLSDQRAATGVLPDDRTVVVERFCDQLGGWQIAVHSPWGRPVNAPWALCLSARIQRRFGFDAQAMAADDGIILRLPDTAVSGEPTAGQPGEDLRELVTFDAEQITDLVTQQLGVSPVFAARFRECAARALLLPRRRPGARQALWQQRQRSAHLLRVASGYPRFPIVLEAVRECLQDVFDVPALVELMRAVAARQIRVVVADTSAPSPFARGLLFGYVGQYLYEDDSPLAERRAAALALDPALLGELLGGDEADLAELLDEQVVARTEDELQRLTPDRRCAHAEDIVDLLRRLGPLTAEDVQARSASQVTLSQVRGWLTELADASRIIGLPVAGQDRWVVVEDAARVRDALGVSLPEGVGSPFTDPVPDPLGDLAVRYARSHGPFTAAQFAAWLGIGAAPAQASLRALADADRLRRLQEKFCDPDVLQLLRRRSLRAVRQQIAPVPAQQFARFLPAWQGVDGSWQGADGLLQAVEQLAGAVLPASALDTLILPSRVRGYTPSLLDELTTAGEVLWQAHGPPTGSDAWVSLHLAEAAEHTLAAPVALPGQVSGGGVSDGDVSGSDVLREEHRAILAMLDGGGAFLFRALAQACDSDDDTRLAGLLWDLVWSGRVSNDTLAPLRSRSEHQRPSRPSRPARRRRLSGRSWPTSRPALGWERPVVPSRPDTAGRWFALPHAPTVATTRAVATAEILLERYGVLTRGSVAVHDPPGGFAAMYRVLSAAAEAGRVRQGYFVEGLGAAQFATSGAVDRLRAAAGAPAADRGCPAESAALVLAAADPANPYGAALRWPATVAADVTAGHAPQATGGGHRPGRKAGAMVVLVAGQLVLYVERGGASVLSWSTDPGVLQVAAQRLAATVQAGATPGLTVERIDGESVFQTTHPAAAALTSAGFHLTPRGLRLRPR